MKLEWKDDHHGDARARSKNRLYYITKMDSGLFSCQVLKTDAASYLLDLGNPVTLAAARKVCQEHEDSYNERLREAQRINQDLSRRIFGK